MYIPLTREDLRYMIGRPLRCDREQSETNHPQGHEQRIRGHPSHPERRFYDLRTRCEDTRVEGSGVGAVGTEFEAK